MLYDREVTVQNSEDSNKTQHGRQNSKIAKKIIKI